MISLFVESTVPSKRKKIFLSQWPTTSTLCCYYCCHTFDTVPIPMVHNEFEFDKCVFHICVDDIERPYPVFCSVNCLIAHISYSNLNKVILIHHAKLIEHFWSGYFQLAEHKECSLQTRPRHHLKMFGGALTINEFRQGTCRFVDKRPDDTSKKKQSIISKTPEKDLIFWPNTFPHIEIPITTTMSSSSQLPLTSMDDPTDQFGHEIDETTAVVVDKPVAMTMVSDILRQTIDTKQIQDVSTTLENLTLQKSSMSSSDNSAAANKTPKQNPKRRKIKANSPPIKTTVVPTTGFPTTGFLTQRVHPMFSGARMARTSITKQ